MGAIIISIFLVMIFLPVFFRILGSFVGLGFELLWGLLKVIWIPLIVIGLCCSGFVFIAFGALVIAGIVWMVSALA